MAFTANHGKPEQARQPKGDFSKAAEEGGLTLAEEKARQKAARKATAERNYFTPKGPHK